MAFRPVLNAAVVAGLIAGAVTTGFHWLFTEPVIDRAIQLEERAREPGGSATEPPVVDRRTQRRGLVVGFLVFGAVWGLLFGLLASRLLAWLPPVWPVAARGVAAALLVGWSVSVMPFLKYPANPPGIGDPGSIGLRQQRYFGLVALSLAGTVLAAGLYRVLSRRHAPGGRMLPRARPAPALIVLILYIGYAAVLYRLMPANPDIATLPADLVRAFRGTSLAGLVLFWVVLGGALGWLTRRAQPSAG